MVDPAVEDQASDRTHRIGQKRLVTAYPVIGYELPAGLPEGGGDMADKVSTEELP